MLLKLICCPGPFYELIPQSEPHLNSCQYPLINYLEIELSNEKIFHSHPTLFLLFSPMVLTVFPDLIHMGIWKNHHHPDQKTFFYHYWKNKTVRLHIIWKLKWTKALTRQKGPNICLSCTKKVVFFSAANCKKRRHFYWGSNKIWTFLFFLEL